MKTEMRCLGNKQRVLARLISVCAVGQMLPGLTIDIV